MYWKAGEFKSGVMFFALNTLLKSFLDTGIFSLDLFCPMDSPVSTPFLATLNMTCALSDIKELKSAGDKSFLASLGV